MHMCAHCKARPAGFWVMAASAQTVRRPWCLYCLENDSPQVPVKIYRISSGELVSLRSCV